MEQETLIIQETDNSITFAVNENVYNKEILFRSCYTFIDEFYLFIDKQEDKFLVMLKKKDKNPSSLNNLMGDFHNELLHQSLRVQIDERTNKLKEIIVGKALYSAEVKQSKSDQEFDEYLAKLEAEMAKLEAESGEEDPLGIAVPWEEKYGDKKNDN